jgi:hypothetical protein
MVEGPCPKAAVFSCSVSVLDTDCPPGARPGPAGGSAVRRHSPRALALARRRQRTRPAWAGGQPQVTTRPKSSARSRTSSTHTISYQADPSIPPSQPAEGQLVQPSRPTWRTTAVTWTSTAAEPARPRLGAAVGVLAGQHLAGPTRPRSPADVGHRGASLVGSSGSRHHRWSTPAPEAGCSILGGPSRVMVAVLTPPARTSMGPGRWGIRPRARAAACSHDAHRRSWRLPLGTPKVENGLLQATRSQQ